MKLGGSLRRRRPSRSGGEGHGIPDIRALLEERRVRLGLLALGVVLAGSGSGYLYATQVMFPGGAEEVLDFREVPHLLDLPIAEAETIVRERGLQVGAIDSIQHPEVPGGTILGQSPLPGQLALPGGSVELTVSLGPERRVIPDVTRLRADRALTVLRTTGFMVAVDSVEAELPGGRIVATVPAAGTELALPSEVRLTVSLGPPLVAMPNLTGVQDERARVVLDSLGLVLGEVETRFRFGFNQGEVLEHFPPADSLIPVGTEVRLVIGRGFF